MIAVIYVRVSSDEQVNGTSLDHQEEICRRYCKEKGFDAIEFFREEGASAKSSNRPEFLRAIEFCRKNKGKVGAFVVAKLDRFARNTNDHYMIRKILSDFGVKLHSVTEPISDDAIGKVFEGMLALFSEFDNNVRKQRCSDGMYRRIKEGIYPWQPPVGYKCNNFKKQGLKKTEPDKPHSTIFTIIQTGLREFSNGLHNKVGLLKRLDTLGLAKEREAKTTPQFIDSLLTEKRLKFYAGLLFDPVSGEYVKAQHHKMISLEDVQKILNVLKGKSNSTAHTRVNPFFPLRGSVLCFDCGGKLTGSFSRSESGGTHAYYHCFRKDCPMRGKGISKDILEKEFTKMLSKVTPNSKWLKLFEASVKDYWQEKGNRYIQEVKDFESKIKTLEEKKKQIFLMREDGSYTKEEFLERKGQIETEMLTLNISLNEAKLENLDIENVLVEATEFLKDLGSKWKDLPPHLQQKFQKLVFPNGFTYEKGKEVRTEKLGYIYTLSSQSNNKKTNLVDPRGFELLTSSVQMRRSTN